MKSRFPLAGCCLLTTLLIGVWFGQLMSSHENDDEVAERMTVSPFGSDGWQLASGSQSGPSAILHSENSVDDRTLTELIDQSATSGHSESEDIANGPDIAYFPEVIVGVGGQSNDQSSEQPTTFFPEMPASPTESETLTDEEAAVWQAELKDLPAGQAQEIIDLRRQLGSVASESLGLSSPESISQQGNAPKLFPFLAESEASPIPLPVATTKESNVTLVSGENIPPALQRLRLEALANHKENLANARTPGFKRRQIILLNISGMATSRSGDRNKKALSVTTQLTDKTSDAAETVQIASHETAESKTSEEPVLPEPIAWLSRLDLRQGELVSTGNPLDIAIDGLGWLQVDRNGRPEYIRAGVLGFDENRELGIRTGGGLLPIQPAIHFPETGRRLVISEAGEVYAFNSKEERHAIGHLMSYEFVDASALRRTDIGTYIETKETVSTMVSPRNSVRFLQSFLEASNVDQKQELADFDHIQSVARQITQTMRSDGSP